MGRLCIEVGEGEFKAPACTDMFQTDFLLLVICVLRIILKV